MSKLRIRARKIGRGNKNLGLLQMFNPSNLSWYDPSNPEGYTLDGSNRVSQLNDLSGNGRHFTQGSAGSRPLLDGTHLINGRPCMYFDATARFLSRTPTPTDAHNLGQSVFAVVEYDTLGAFSVIYSRYGASGRREFELLKQDATAPANTIYTIHSQDGSAVQAVGRVSTVVTNTPYLAYGIVQNNSYVEAGVNNARADQRFPITGSVYNSPSTPPAITLGCRTGGTFQMRGKIAEVICVSGPITVAQKDFILNYLGKKWNINSILSGQDETTSVVGQSNIDLWFTDDANYTFEGQNAFQNKLLTVRKSQIFTRQSQSGSTVTQVAESGSSYWVTTALGDGPMLTGFITNAASYGLGIRGDLNRLKNILVVNGEGDAVAIGSALLTKADFKNALRYLVERLNAVAPNAKIIFTPVGRRTGGSDTGTQQVRDAQLEIIAEKPYCSLGWENHDLTLRDNIHRNAAGYTVEGTRAAEFVLTGEIRGPIITSATYSGNTVTATVQLDGNYYLTGSEVDTFRIEDDGVAVTINSLTINGTTITFNLSAPIVAGSVVNLWCNYGQGLNVTPANVVMDINGYPIRTVSALNVTAAE